MPANHSPGSPQVGPSELLRLRRAQVPAERATARAWWELYEPTTQTASAFLHNHNQDEAQEPASTRSIEQFLSTPANRYDG